MLVYQRVYLHGWIQCVEELLVFIRHFLIFKARQGMMTLMIILLG